MTDCKIIWVVTTAKRPLWILAKTLERALDKLREADLLEPDEMIVSVCIAGTIDVY